MFSFLVIDGPLVPKDAKPDDPDLLMKEYIFSQIFTVPKANRERFETGIRAYIPYMLNDFGMYFYRATYLTAVEGDQVKVQVNLYLITAKRFTEEKYLKTSRIVREFVDSKEPVDLYVKGLYAGYSSTVYFQQKTFAREAKYQ